MAEHQPAVPGGVVGPRGMLGPARPAELQLQPSPERQRHTHMFPNNNSVHTQRRLVPCHEPQLCQRRHPRPLHPSRPGPPANATPLYPPLLHPAGSLCGLISGEIGELQAQAHTHTHSAASTPPSAPHPPIHIQLANCRLRHSSADTSA